MRRFVMGWKVLGYARRFDAEIVNYADDLVVCGKASAETMRGVVEDMMERLRVPINAAKTRSMRVPEEREGGATASLGAWRVAERRIRRIYERYGAGTVHAAVRINLDRTERRLRERIAELPDGSYCYEDYLEYYEEGRLDPVLVVTALPAQRHAQEREEHARLHHPGQASRKTPGRP